MVRMTWKCPLKALLFGFLVEMRYPFILGSVRMAVDAINKDSSVLPNVKLDFLFDRIHSESNVKRGPSGRSHH